MARRFCSPASSVSPPRGALRTCCNFGAPTTVSVRQVQLPQTQFYEAKPYPAFTPTGPALVLLGADELKRFTDLRRKLWVNGKLRQNVTAADMAPPRPMR